MLTRLSRILHQRGPAAEARAHVSEMRRQLWRAAALKLRPSAAALLTALRQTAMLQVVPESAPAPGTCVLFGPGRRVAPYKLVDLSGNEQAGQWMLCAHGVYAARTLVCVNTEPDRVYTRFAQERDYDTASADERWRYAQYMFGF